MLKYNYVFFDASDFSWRGVDINNYYYICTQELRDFEDVQVVSCIADYSILLHYLNSIHRKIEKIIYDGVFEHEYIWYPYYFKNKFKNNKPICFVIYGYYITPQYIQYLKTTYPKCKIVKIHRDLIQKWYNKNPLFKGYDNLYDLILTYDKAEAIKYNIYHFDEFESKLDLKRNSVYPLHEVFFAGLAKDRLPQLIKAYDRLNEANIDCFFFIVGVKDCDRVYRKGIVYSNKNMSYKEMLYHSINSKFLLEINQKGAIGYTSRFLEAVMYDICLITNNLDIKKSKFYNPKYIQCFEKVEEIDTTWVRNNIQSPDFMYKNDFSPRNLILKIDGLLNNE